MTGLMKVLVLSLLALLPSCAYKGDVYIYSPAGAENVIEKAVSTEASLTGL
jgi:hypothetical protein